MINHDSVWRDHKTHLNSLIRLPVPEGSNRAESDGSDEQKIISTPGTNPQ